MVQSLGGFESSDCPQRSGMTNRFFALFFWQQLGMQPIATNAVYAGGPVGIALTALLMQRVSVRAGRTLTTVVCRACSVLLLASIALIMLEAPALPPSPPCAPPAPAPTPSRANATTHDDGGDWGAAEDEAAPPWWVSGAGWSGGGWEWEQQQYM